MTEVTDVPVPGSKPLLEKHAAELRGAEHRPFPVKKDEIPWEHKVCWTTIQVFSGFVSLSSITFTF